MFVSFYNQFSSICKLFSVNLLGVSDFKVDTRFTSKIRNVKLCLSALKCNAGMEFNSRVSLS